MNNRQLQEAIDKTQQVVMNKDLWNSVKDLSIKHLEKLYNIQAARAEMAITPRTTLQDIK